MLFYQLRPRNLGGDTVIGVTVSIQQHVDAMLSYLRGREFLFAVYDSVPEEEELASTIQRVAQDYNLQAAITPTRQRGTNGDGIDAYRQAVSLTWRA
jgi:hypothetical protein